MWVDANLSMTEGMVVLLLGATNLAQAGETFALFRLDVSPDFFFRWGLLFLFFGAAAGIIGSMLGLSKYLRDADGTGPDVPTGF
jgi:hypothetical protein